MARPENPIDPTAPYATFARQLRKLRQSSGSPTYTTLARRAKYSVSALSQAAAGRKLPSLELTLAYATACGGGREHWTEQWLIAQHPTGPGPLDGPAAAEVRPWSTEPPVPALAGTPQEFIACLRELKLWAGNPSLSRLEAVAFGRGCRLPRSTIGDALSRSRASLPNAFVVRSLVLACLTVAQRQSRIHAEETRPVAEEWQEHWLRVHRNCQRPPRPVSAPAASRVLAETVQTVVLPPRQDHALNPIGEVPHEQRLLAQALRELFDKLGVSLRRFAARHHVNPSTLSRYLSGSRIPPRDFLRVLVREASLCRGQEPAPEALRRLQALHLAALRARPTLPAPLPEADRLDELRQALDDAHAQLRRSIELEAALKAQLRELQGPRSPQPA
ncbi:helix-turn-helix transcriptional regulator [Streptomyces syringium]|uniref:Transcriptional regulator with XRE-family HTH domain n=1 Tax=Streptomyces syringium TaxID=76729 RepID=A0ABS4Y734_9ACTN|nr:helix-turn-helix transcriptional regulator [Streptomyces syringium]MBP2404602.1 transcriptional regulator with XRE-family HTH domain [Streptomyces syringium]